MPQEVHELLKHKVLYGVGSLNVHGHLGAVKVKVLAEHPDGEQGPPEGPLAAHQGRVCRVHLVLLVTVEHYVCQMPRGQVC